MVDQCIQGEGPVQINVQIKEEVNDHGKKVRKINIIDVLKPSDDAIAGAQIEDSLQDGEAANDESGFSVSMSADGRVVAIRAPYNDDNGSDSGYMIYDK